jgi:hypothetical protein
MEETVPIVIETVVVEDVAREPPDRAPASVSWDCEACGRRFRSSLRYLITVRNRCGHPARRRVTACDVCVQRADHQLA